MRSDDEIPHRPPDAHPELPFERPFTHLQARESGVSRNVLGRLVRTGLLRRVFPGVYVDSAVPDDQLSRTRALGLILPATAVVTDETAGWVHMVDVDPPGAHVVAPPIHVFQMPGATRIRKSGCAGGERTLAAYDVVVVNGIRTTTMLRTALDMGRLRSRDRAIAALDGFLRHGDFSRADLLAQVERFRGMRGVVQLRELAPFADGRAESPAESVVRLRCAEAGLPHFEPQVEVRRHGGWLERAVLDLANERLRFAVEYDGRAWHTSPEQRSRDRHRRGWLRAEEGWGFAVLEDQHVYAPDRGRTAHVVRRALDAHLRRTA